MKVIDYGVASHALAGPDESGDLHVVEFTEDRILLAAIDGIGHGQSAASAAMLASEILRSSPLASPELLMQRCHDALRFTRGVVMSLAVIFPLAHQMVWLGVGNVLAALRRGDSPVGMLQETLLLRGGVVGAQLPALQTSTLSLRRGDILFLATDGIESDFVFDSAPFAAPQTCADNILKNYSRGTDDALVLVARYLGGLS